MSKRKLQKYTGNEVASQPSIAEQLLRGTKIGNLLYGKPKTYRDGWGNEKQDATFKESTNGQLVQRMGETAKDTGNLVLTGLAFGNPLTASSAMAPLITGAQAYWIGRGIQDGTQRIENIGEGVQNFVENPSWQTVGKVAKEVPMLALDVASAIPVAKTATIVAKQMLKPTPKYTPAEQVIITQPTTSKLTEAERLGIPKGERSNPKAIENPHYWGYRQWNERYNAAVRAGNWEEIQRLRDLHFITKAPNTKVVDEKGMPRHMYHGPGRNYKGKPNRFTTFKGVNWDLEHLVKEGAAQNHRRLSKPNGKRMSNYHAPRYETALIYSFVDPTNIHDDYLNITNPFTYNEEKIHQILLNAGRKSEKIPYKVPGRFKMQMVKDENGKIMRDKSGMPIYEKGEWIPEKYDFRYPYVSDWADFAGSSKEELMKLGYDGLYIPQYYDSYGAFISPSQFKSADPITWDGKGEIIPIVKRDNFRNLDTRYSKGGKINPQQ